MELGTEEIAGIAAAVVTIANIITMATPSTHDNQILNGILKILNLLSLNVGKNKNADDPA